MWVRGWPQTLNNTLKGVKKDSEDILAHLERDMMEKRTAVKTLGQKVNALSTELEATNLRIAELEKVSVRILIRSPILKGFTDVCPDTESARRAAEAALGLAHWPSRQVLAVSVTTSRCHPVLAARARCLTGPDAGACDGSPAKLMDVV